MSQPVFSKRVYEHPTELDPTRMSSTRPTHVNGPSSAGVRRNLTGETRVLYT